MRTLIKLYLLAKSAFRRKFELFDIEIAKAAVYLDGDLPTPEWLAMIAQLQQTQALPEAFGFFVFLLGVSISSVLYRIPAAVRKAVHR